MSRAVATQEDTAQGVNAVLNHAVKPTHSPKPSLESSLNAQAREWWTSSINKPQIRTPPVPSLQIPSDWPMDVVFLTHNLVAPSVPDSIAQRYVLQPSTASSSSSDNSDVVGPSSPKDLPRATHNDGQAETLYTTSIQEQVPLVIWPIDRNTPWDPECFHSTSRNLTCHPSAGSYGLFAGQDLPCNTFIRPYLGVLHTKADADFHSTYDLSLCHDPRMAASDSPDDAATELKNLSLAGDKDKSQDEHHNPTALYIDSRHWGNESRFVNDYRGIASKPNVEFRSFIQLSDDSQQAERPKFQMGLFATRPIRKGQELVINYGKSYWVHHEQLTELEKPKSQYAPSSPATATPTTASGSATKLDPIQAMLQRSRMRVSRTALNPQRPPHQPSPPPPPSHT
ncbi:uncharacterized protein UTRI_05159_B [Ustilago trichophora]|uniref:SET domain-containing protein n=1 Tax=Ustilago trichophora TaxID=86804 RepID=A0A5C3EE21_9BASI|nr:uncharacterized protein UTRI_05159_B [Ustilago trichophora]